eukprot:jgi/Psemu1/10103/gm1.10103_g
MEPKTSYSNMAAKPPPKANDATTNGPPPKPKNQTTKRDPDRFVGHNQTDLKGILVPEDATAKHYNGLKERLETLRGSKYVPQVGSSIEHLIRFERKDFVPTKPTAQEYSTTVTDPVTQTAQAMEVSGLKETLMNMYKEELKKKADVWIQYQRDMMEKMYRLTLGQIDDGMKAKLKGLKAWKSIDSSKCVVELFNCTKVHPVTNVLRAVQKLLCTQQRNLDAASYVKMVKENLDVVKLLGGTLVCKATVSYELEVNPLYKFYDYMAYLSLTGATRTAIGRAVEQRAIAALILIEGSDTDNSNLRQVLADNYTLQQNNYPATRGPVVDEDLEGVLGSGGDGHCATAVVPDESSLVLNMEPIEPCLRNASGEGAIAAEDQDVTEPPRVMLESVAEGGEERGQVADGRHFVWKQPGFVVGVGKDFGVTVGQEANWVVRVEHVLERHNTGSGCQTDGGNNVSSEEIVNLHWHSWRNADPRAARDDVLTVLKDPALREFKCAWTTLQSATNVQRSRLEGGNRFVAPPVSGHLYACLLGNGVPIGGAEATAKGLALPYGAYAQTSRDEIDNTMKTQATGAIVMEPTQNFQAIKRMIECIARNSRLGLLFADQNNGPYDTDQDNDNSNDSSYTPDSECDPNDDDDSATEPAGVTNADSDSDTNFDNKSESESDTGDLEGRIEPEDITDITEVQQETNNDTEKNIKITGVDGVTEAEDEEAINEEGQKYTRSG